MMKQQDSDSGVANADFQSSGNYEFTNVIDIGAKHTARITASLTQTSIIQMIYLIIEVVILIR